MTADIKQECEAVDTNFNGGGQSTTLGPASKKRKTLHGLDGELRKLQKRDNAFIRANVPKHVTFDTAAPVLLKMNFPQSEHRLNVAPGSDPPQTFTLGLAKNHFRGALVSTATKIVPDLVAMVHELAPSGFPYSSATLNKDLECRLHVDVHNSGLSHIAAVGTFSGGELWLFDEKAWIASQAARFQPGREVPDKENLVWEKVTEPLPGWPQLAVGSKIPGRIHNILHRWFPFYGNCPHKTMPFQGSRVSIVLYTRNEWPTVPEKVRNDLGLMGFTLPAMPTTEAAVKQELSTKRVSHVKQTMLSFMSSRQSPVPLSRYQDIITIEESDAEEMLAPEVDPVEEIQSSQEDRQPLQEKQAVQSLAQFI